MKSLAEFGANLSLTVVEPSHLNNLSQRLSASAVALSQTAVLPLSKSRKTVRGAEQRPIEVKLQLTYSAPFLSFLSEGVSPPSHEEENRQVARNFRFFSVKRNTTVAESSKLKSTR